MGGSLRTPATVSLEAVVALTGKNCHPKGSKPDQKYGTSGFRTKAELLDHIFFRMGILAVLRSKALNGACIGVMVTASHNKEEDNGAKISDPKGEMLPDSWEGHATAIANADDDDLAKVMTGIVTAESIDLDCAASVVIGRDTRASSPSAAVAVADGVTCMQKSAVYMLGLTSTPQLHFVTRCSNDPSYGHPSIVHYNYKLTNAFAKLCEEAPSPKVYKPTLTVDCANGVGGIALKAMLEAVKNLDITLVNTGPGDGPLNSGCGADHVKMTQGLPSGVKGKTGRMATLDGDADRIMYFFSDAEGVYLLDGDRIALLLARWLIEQSKLAGFREALKIGCVQTAYANGASTAFAQQVLGAENVHCAKTGVKNLHPVAEALDVGIYAEANGHGNVCFSRKFVDKAEDVAQSGGSVQSAAANRLLLMRDIINESVGDSLSLLLAVEAILRHMDWDCAQWCGIYEELPYRQVKVVVKDRFIFETTDSERKCVKPEGLQDKIDQFVAAAPSGRAFVRPSGTEDVVRVYAEAATLKATLKLCQAVVDVVFTDGGGTGSKPEVS
mmetsp:Transcript_42327/g.76789  ORF Transcript_42327/g.76789 Transcript_42327/m.76789 type:complete len:556 (+) Transcript_42327:48-1715(+)